MTSPFVQIGYAELKVRAIGYAELKARGCIFCSQQTARTMLSNVVSVVAKIPHVMLLPKFNALKVFNAVKGEGAITLRLLLGERRSLSKPF